MSKHIRHNSMADRIGTGYTTHNPPTKTTRGERRKARKEECRKAGEQYNPNDYKNKN